MFKDIESAMSAILTDFKTHIPTYVALMNTEKGDTLLTTTWAFNAAAVYEDALIDFPPYNLFFLLFEAKDPIINANQFDAIETYTLGFVVGIADDMEDARNFYKAKKRYNRIIKQIITKQLVKKYTNSNILIKDQKSEVVTSPNGVIYETSAVYFDITLTIT